MVFPQHNITAKPEQADILKKRDDFLRLRSGRKFHGKSFTLQAKKSNQANTGPRIGFTVTRKVGNAVVRNRIKRRLKNVANLELLKKAKKGYDYVLIARRSALHQEFETLLNELSQGLDQVHGKRANDRH